MAIAVANRYARALADVVGQKGEFRRTQKELEDFAEVYRASPQLQELLRTPAVTLPGKAKVLSAILARLETSEISSNFLNVLAANYRMDLIEGILEAYRRIANHRLGIVPVKVYSADELSEADREALRARFAALTGSRVELEFNRDEQLLGGIRAQIGSTVYDGSLRGHLDRIRQKLIAR